MLRFGWLASLFTFIFGVFTVSHLSPPSDLPTVGSDEGYRATTSLAGCQSATLGTRTPQAASNVDSCTTLNFRFLTVYDVPLSSNVRHVELFLEEKSFNEANLKKLFSYVSRQHPKTPILIVSVYTNWAQLSPTSGDCPGSASSNQPQRPDEYDYHQARYRRGGGTEHFEYSKRLKDSDFKRVWLRK